MNIIMQHCGSQRSGEHSISGTNVYSVTLVFVSWKRELTVD